MTESLSQTQLIEDTNRFGKYKGATSYVNGNSGDDEIYNYNSNSNNNSNGASHHRSFSPTTTPSSVIYTVVLQPFDSHFPVKTIEIKENTKCRIGRQSSAKTVPKPLNGYFDSKVLSRNHAILWSEPEGGGVWIKDTKSSNGTFLNGQRLSAELEESEPFELKTGDQIAFGIDIVGEDGSVLYHKVACSISIFNIPVDQMDLSTLKGFNLMNGLTPEADMSQQRRSSVSSVASGKDTITTHSSKPLANQNKQWELLLAKLEVEFHRSQDVEKELLGLKEAVGEMDKSHDEDRLRKLNALNTSLHDQLDKAQHQLDEYAKKTQLQDQALSSAHKQLMEIRQSTNSKSRNAGMDGSSGLEWQHQLEQIRLELVEEKKKHTKDLAVEKSRCSEYEQKCATLERQLWKLQQDQQSLAKASSHPLQQDQRSMSLGFVDILHIRSVQILVGVMVAILSILIYISF